jgi:hypothetical protein
LDPFGIPFQLRHLLEFAATITGDVASFLGAFPEHSSEWQQVLASLKNTFGKQVRPAPLRSAIQTFFRLKNL